MKFFILALLTIAVFCKNDKVSVDLYSESLCPFCRQTIQTSFKQAHNTKDFYEIAEVNIYAYGNANEVKNGSYYSYTCQHGPNECVGNLIEVCAQHFYKNFDYISFVICLEEEVSSDFYAAGSKCAKKLHLDFNEVETCSKNSQGNALQHAVAVKTASLNPPHQYVPWIVANGKHTQGINNAVQKSLLNYVCANYKGSVKIAACKKDVKIINGRSYKTPSDFINYWMNYKKNE